MALPDFNEKVALLGEVRRRPVQPGCFAVAESGGRTLSAKLQLASRQRDARRYDLPMAKMCPLLSSNT